MAGPATAPATGYGLDILEINDAEIEAAAWMLEAAQEAEDIENTAA